jgi:uncharacterized protein YyaL (SSP411 family)
MNLPNTRRVVVFALGVVLLGSVSCRKKQAVAKDSFANPTVVASELKRNALEGLPGAVYQSQVDSPIHWQPWTHEALDRAADANRLVFAVIAMPQQQGFRSVLADLAKDASLVAAINDNYVPVLIDGDASREIGLLTADLCAEIKRSLQLPLFLWMSPSGDPVAWIPVASSSKDSVADLFYQSHNMVNRTWREDFAYVAKNSSLDNGSRRERISQRKANKVMSAEPALDAVRGLRQLASFYDPFSRSFDEAGGLFPAGSIELLAAGAMHPGLPAEVRSRCVETTRELLIDLLPSAMFDPLEGGVFSSRKANSWTLPSFSRDCVTQARVAVALLNAYRAVGDPRALEKALDLLAFAEKSFKTTEGLFAVGASAEGDTAAWLWSVEDIQKALPAEDAAWWIRANHMKDLGNLATEADPKRTYFRSNSLALGMSLADLAASQSQSVEAFKPRFESARQALLKVRNARVKPAPSDDSSHAGATFRMVSAYAAAFGATGKDEYRQKSVELLEKAKTAFSTGAKLRTFSKETPSAIGDGRAFLYGLALQAALDVADISSEEKWLVWAEDIATVAAELFTSSEFLKECDDEAKIIDLPITDLVMLFDDSTAGLISAAECRLAERGRPLVASFSELATPLPNYVATRPILHTDLLMATIARHYKVSVVLGADLSPELKLAVERLPLRTVQRRLAKATEQIPAGSVLIQLGEGEPIVVSTVEALQQAILPSP